MKKAILLTALAASLLFLSSCGGSSVVEVTPAEVDTYITQNPNIPDFDKECLRNGTVKMGIKSETLRFMFGEPKEITPVQQAWALQEYWLYKNGGKKTFIIEDGGVVGIEEEE